MTDREKLKKIKSLADKMYSRMAYLTSDTRPIRKAMEEYHQFIINEYHKEEPVSEELGEIVLEGTNFNKSWYAHPELAFKAGANWQKEQFEKNRLKHCNSITNEQAELESDFVSRHIEQNNRMPTFLDAIEYGMRLQREQKTIIKND